jgi:hypothetical protein
MVRLQRRTIFTASKSWSVRLGPALLGVTSKLTLGSASSFEINKQLNILKEGRKLYQLTARSYHNITIFSPLSFTLVHI